jgi:hypothetical protein
LRVVGSKIHTACVSEIQIQNGGSRTRDPEIQTRDPKQGSMDPRFQREEGINLIRMISFSKRVREEQLSI